MPKDLAVQINDAVALLGKAKASMQRAFLRPRTDDRVDFDHDLIGGKYGLLVGFASLGKARLVDCLSHVLGLQGNAVQFTAYRVPSDILCSDVLEQSQNGTRQFCFLEGLFLSTVAGRWDKPRCTERFFFKSIGAIAAFDQCLGLCADGP